MTLYIEYVFLENFFIDGTLLYLAFSLLKRRICYIKIVLSSVLGGAFAITYPFLTLPSFLSVCLKFSVGLLLTVFASKKEKGIGRYALNAAVFFGLSFLFAGGLIAVYNLLSVQQSGYSIEKLPVGALTAGGVLFVFLTLKTGKAFYKRRKITRFLYRCTFVSKENVLKVTGYLDSGNLASFHGAPVCFLTPESFLQLIGAGQVFDEMEITTVSGAKKIKIFKLDELRIYLDGGAHIIQSVYVSPSARLKNREYEALLNGLLFE